MIAETGDFEDFPAIQQVAIAAIRHKTADNPNDLAVLNEQGTDYQIIAGTTSNVTIRAGAERNNAFLRTYTSNGSHDLSPEALESWDAYNNWVLGIEDIRSSYPIVRTGETVYKVWSGKPLDYYGYNGWHIHHKSNDFNAVAYV